MSAIKVPIVRPEACKGDDGVYFADVYFTQPNGQTCFRQLPLGWDRPNVKRPLAVFDLLREQVDDQWRQVVPMGKMVAVAVTRACWKTHQRGETRLPPISLTGERVGSFVLARSLDDIEPIEPLQPPERPNPQGIGSARRKIAGTVPIRPLIHLPVTQEEYREYPVHAAMRGLPSRGMSNDPYVALHGNIEQILILG